MLNTNIRPLVASDIVKPAQYWPLRLLRMSSLFLLNNLVHIKISATDAVNLHTGELIIIDGNNVVIEIVNPTLTGTIRVC